MAVTVTTRLPEKFVTELKAISKSENLDKSEVIRRMLAGSIKHWKLKKAIKMYKEGTFSIGQAAEFVNISVWRFMEVLRKNKIPFSYDVEEFKEDVKTVKWLMKQ